MKSLFDKTKIDNMELKNRFIRSATIENAAGDKGHLNERTFELYEGFAKGGVGLIITTFMYYPVPGFHGKYWLFGDLCSWCSKLSSN
ncbi:MAG: hypothetical protein WCD89_25080 [Anaerocolumna sp.]